MVPSASEDRAAFVEFCGGDELVPYWTTGVFGLDGGAWRWLYWGGSEPQESAKV